MKKICIIISFTIILCMLFACQFFTNVQKEITKNYDDDITEVILSKKNITIAVRDSEYITLTLNPKANQGKNTIKWTFDETYVSVAPDNFGAIITGKKEGETYIKATCNGIVATCLITIEGNGELNNGEPYIYSNDTVIELKPDDTKTITASLYGGNIADMEMFQWSVKDESIASIVYSRNNCIITAHKTGSTQIIAKHPKAEYEYSFIVFVYTDKLTEPFITTERNVITLNKNETENTQITVDLINPLSSTYKNGFTWNYADEKSKDIISFIPNLNTANITPKESGTAKIIVSHENAQFDLEIIIRVISIVKNTYIEVNTSSLIITDSETLHTLYANIGNYTDYVNPDKFKWELPPEADTLCEYVASGNSLQIMGKKNGTFKITVSHELSEYNRTIVVILQNQIGSAIDSSMYITTTQNYIQTQVGREATTIQVRLVGGIEGEDDIGDDTTNFSWWIDNAYNNEIVEVQNVTGVIKDNLSRSVGAASSGNSVSATLEIKPLKEGEVTIVVTHPRCLYDTEIKVKVYSETALVNPVTIITDESVIRMLNGSTKEITARLTHATGQMENNIQWSSDNTAVITVSPSTGKTTQINAIGTGQNQTYITSHLDEALNDKKILVLTADTNEELETMKGIYTDSSYLRIASDEVKEIFVESFGLSLSDVISWKTSNSSICTVSAISSSTNKNTARVTGVSEGKATITASLENCKDVIFEVTVLKKGESSEIFDEDAGYLTTMQNAIVTLEPGETQNLSVTGVNISQKNMDLYTTWTMNDINPIPNEPVFDIVPNGANATLVANRPGKSSVIIKNKFSQNSLSIQAKVGELYEWIDNYIIYITTDEDVVNIVNGQTYTIGAALVNTTQTGMFSWSIDKGNDIIDIIGLASGTCTITTKEPGQAIIKVTNTLCPDMEKEFLINVGNTEEELKGFKYLTTKQNVVTIAKGSTASVSVDIKNSDNPVVNGYTWRSQNNTIASVTGSSNVAVIKGEKEGTVKIEIENPSNCLYPLEIICNIVDPIVSANDPYIACNSIVTTTVGKEDALIVAQLIGGNEIDTSNFSWSIQDSSIARLYASNDTAQIKALKEGVTQVIITHPKAATPRSVLIIVNQEIKTDCYINIPESIIRLSPTGDAKTLSANLINGNANDVYDFKWWADDYSLINMDYSGSSCLVEPLRAGTVTIHVSHPKAMQQKDIIIYISNYSDFSFSKTNITLETGKQTFINMETPATYFDALVSYSSSDPNLCNAEGNTSVCILSPGTLPNGVNSAKCTITAKLLTKSGTVQATAELLVVITKKDETKPYIALINPNTTIITMNKGEKRSFISELKGNTIVDTSSNGLNWSINKDNGKIAQFNGPSSGKTIQLEALVSGKTTITITHSEAQNPLTIYLIVLGEEDPTINLNYDILPIYIGEDTITLSAKVQNDKGEEINWTVDGNKDDELFSFTTKDKNAFIYAKKPGKATITASLPSGSTDTCEIEIKENEKIQFFVYDDEQTQSNKKYIKTLQLYPGETKPLHWEAIPEKDPIIDWYRSDNSYFSIDTQNAGYGKTWKSSENITYTYPDNIGTIIVTGATKEGGATLKAKTNSNMEDSVFINNSYGYLLKTSKTIVSATPQAVSNDKSILYIDYEIRPAPSHLIITLLGDVETENLFISNSNASYDASQKQYIITQHDIIDTETGIAKGTLKFEIKGEVNGEVEIKGRNENIISTGGVTPVPQEFGTSKLLYKIYYTQHTFKAEIKQKVPFLNNEIYPVTEQNTYYSSYNSNNIFVLGDGEYISGNILVDQTNKAFVNVPIKAICFKPEPNNKTDGHGNKQAGLVKARGADVEGINTQSFYLYHELDYGLILYKKNGQDKKSGIFYGYKKNDEAAYPENYNETVKENSYVGSLEIDYYSFYAKKYQTYKIPVYVEVRNVPCSINTNYKRADAY